MHNMHRDLRANSFGGSSMYGGMSLPDAHDSKVLDTNNYLREQPMDNEPQQPYSLFKQADPGTAAGEQGTLNPNKLGQVRDFDSVIPSEPSMVS